MNAMRSTPYPGSLPILASTALLASGLLAGCGASTPRATGPFAGDAKNATYTVKGSSIALRNGAAAVGGGEVSLTEAGLELDLNDDGVTDRVVVLAKSSDTSTTMYLAALLSDGGQYTAVPAVSLGHELVVKSLATGERGTIQVHLLVPDEKAQDKMRPSKKVTKQFAFANGALRDITPDEPTASAGE
jgi:hypothetical protein